MPGRATVELARAARAAASTLRRARTLMESSDGESRTQLSSANVYAFLEMRAYGRHALGKVVRRVQSAERGQSVLMELMALLRDLRGLESRIFGSLSWPFVAQSVADELTLRAADDSAIRWLEALASAKPMVVPLVAEGELIELENALLTRAGARLVWRELEGLEHRMAQRGGPMDAADGAPRISLAQRAFRDQDEAFWLHIGAHHDDHPAVWKTREDLFSAYFEADEHDHTPASQFSNELVEHELTIRDLPWGPERPDGHHAF